MKKPSLGIVAWNFLIFRCAPILTFTMCVILYKTKNDVFIIVDNWPHLDTL